MDGYLHAYCLDYTPAMSMEIFYALKRRASHVREFSVPMDLRGNESDINQLVNRI